MKTKWIPIAVVALAMVVSSVVPVQAGGGAGVPLDVFVADCYLISGSNPPHTLTLDDQFFPGPVDQRTGVQLGKARLLCTPAAGAIVTSQHDVRAGLLTDHLKCYEAPPQGDAPNVSVQVVDPFVTEIVTVGVPKFVCVGAVKCPLGVSCPEE